MHPASNKYTLSIVSCSSWSCHVCQTAWHCNSTLSSCTARLLWQVAQHSCSWKVKYLVQICQQSCLSCFRDDCHLQLFWSEVAPQLKVQTEGVQELQHCCHLPHGLHLPQLLCMLLCCQSPLNCCRSKKQQVSTGTGTTCLRPSVPLLQCGQYLPEMLCMLVSPVTLHCCSVNRLSRCR